MTEKTKKPQYAEIEQPFGCDPPLAHCPICGQATLDDKGGGATPCPHLAFIYVSETGDFEFMSPDFKKRTGRLNKEELDLNTLPEFLAMAGYGNNLLAIEITFGGMACGPIWDAVVFGFDYASLSKNPKAQSDRRGRSPSCPQTTRC